MQRIAKQQTIHFYTDWPQAASHVGHSEDLSHNGMRLVTRQEVASGVLLKIDCDACCAIARVTHCEKMRSVLMQKWIVGVEFVCVRFHQPQGTFVSREA